MSGHPLDDTIAAIASPPGGAARGIVRVSGPEAAAAVWQYFRAADGRQWSPVAKPTAIPGLLQLPELASPLPCELYLWPPRRSYTGDPVAEIHTVGSRPLLEAVLRELCAAGARLAEPGEFTLRAFLSGRIDLTQAEAVLGVIDAADPGEFEVALSQLAGGLAGPLHSLRDALLDLLAHLEAGLDFADEDLPFITAGQLNRQLAEAAESVEKLAAQMASRGETAGAIRVVLVGWPNTGKSSLFNALLYSVNGPSVDGPSVNGPSVDGPSAGALVCERPGTTRDYLTAEVDLGGTKCQLIDTAGVVPEESHPTNDAPPTTGSVERAAQAASREQSRRAHVHLLCIDSTRPLVDWERDALAQGPGPGCERVVVLTKSDLDRHTDFTQRGLSTSSVTGEGIDALLGRLRHAVLWAGASGAEVVAGTAARCRESLRAAAEGLSRARDIVRTGGGEELAAAEIRVALAELGKVVGAVYTDDVLDRIFSRFCIGK